MCVPNSASLPFACHISSDFLSCSWHACDLYLVRCCLSLSFSVVVFVFADAPNSFSLLALSVSFPNTLSIRFPSACFASPVSACCDRVFTLDACGFDSCSYLATIITFPRAIILPVLFFLFFHFSPTRSSSAHIALIHQPACKRCVRHHLFHPQPIQYTSLFTLTLLYPHHREFWSSSSFKSNAFVALPSIGSSLPSEKRLSKNSAFYSLAAVTIASYPLLLSCYCRPEYG